VSKHTSGRVLLWIATLSCLLASASPLLGATLDARNPDPRPTTQRYPEPTYRAKVGFDGEIFPAFANFVSLQEPGDRDWGVVSLTVTNPTSETVHNRVAVKVPGWSDEEIQGVEINVGEKRTFLFAPTFLPRFYGNREIVGATALITVRDLKNNIVFETTLPIRLRSADDIYWGENFKYAPLIASWVTPHDPRIEALLSQAKELMPDRRLPGYESKLSVAAQERSTRLQARAIYLGLQRHGLSYVKSSMTLGRHVGLAERVRLPGESLSRDSANCIDGAVLYASLFENLGMDAVIALVPGHAYVGVRLAPESPHYLYIETALTARVPFDVSVNAARLGLARYAKSLIRLIPIPDARQAGIFPMPETPSSAPARSTLNASTQPK
jgi:hypothetical protein